MKLLIFALIPLILTIGIIPFVDAAEYMQICIDKVWVEKNSSGKIACVTSSTSDKLVERNWGTILSDDVFDEPKVFESGITQEETDFDKNCCC